MLAFLMDILRELYLPITCAIGIFALAIIVASIRVVQEYERGILFRLGRASSKVKDPGLRLIFPIIDRMVKVDVRTVVIDVPPQEVITKDNVTVRVNAVVYFNVTDPRAAIVQVENYRNATYQIAQTSLRNVIGQSSLDQLLADREAINHTLQKIIDQATDPWGIKVTIVEIKDVELNQQMIRAMAREAEAERERRAKIIHAEGELEASEKLAQAADKIAGSPGAMTLRYLQTLMEIGVENNTTTIFPIPIDLLAGMMPKILGDEPPKK